MMYLHVFDNIGDSERHDSNGPDRDVFGRGKNLHSDGKACRMEKKIAAANTRNKGVPRRTRSISHIRVSK